MGTHYLAWLAPVFEVAQVPLSSATAPTLDKALRRIAGVGADTDQRVLYDQLRARWLAHGPPGVQLLCSLIRGEVYGRRESPMRPGEGGGYFTNEGAVSCPDASAGRDGAPPSGG